MTLILSNYRGVESGIDLEILDEGKTWMDMRRRVTDGSRASQPEWSVDVTSYMMLPGGNYITDQELTAGTYIAVCWTNIPHRMYLGGQLVVEE